MLICIDTVDRKLKAGMWILGTVSFRFRCSCRMHYVLARAVSARLSRSGRSDGLNTHTGRTHQLRRRTSPDGLGSEARVGGGESLRQRGWRSKIAKSREVSQEASESREAGDGWKRIRSRGYYWLVMLAVVGRDHVGGWRGNGKVC